MKVLMVGSDPSGRGGMSTVAALILRYGDEVASIRYVSTYSDGSAATRVRTWLAGWARTAWLLLTDRPDVLHAHVSERSSLLRKGVLLGLSRVLRVPSVLHCHGAFLLDWYAGLPRVLRAAVRSVFASASVVGALSEQWRQRYVREFHLVPERVRVLGNPVVLPDEVPVRDGAPVGVLFLGRFDVTKGSADLIRAVARLPRDGRVRVTLAGAGDAAPLRAMARDLGVEAEIHGYLGARDRDAALAAHDVIVLPSRNEVLPMVVLEGMGYGLVPVVTPVGALPEILTDRSDALFVPAGDIGALGDALRELVADPLLRATLSARARETVDQFDVHRYLARLATLWKELV